MAAHFWQFSNHKMAKKENFQILCNTIVKLHTGKLQTKFQVPGMSAIQMNEFSVSRFEGFAHTVLTGKYHFQKF